MGKLVNYTGFSGTGINSLTSNKLITRSLAETLIQSCYQITWSKVYAASQLIEIDTWSITKKTYNISKSSNFSSWSSISSGSLPTTVSCGDSVSFTLSPASGYSTLGSGSITGDANVTINGTSATSWTETSSNVVVNIQDITSGMTINLNQGTVSATTYTITFNSNGGSGTMNTQTVIENTATAINSNTFTRSDYTFSGWATSSTGSVVYADGANITLTGNITLYAVWKQIVHTLSATGTLSTCATDSSGITVKYDDSTITNYTISPTVAINNTESTKTYTISYAGLSTTVTQEANAFTASNSYDSSSYVINPQTDPTVSSDTTSYTFSATATEEYTINYSSSKGCGSKSSVFGNIFNATGEIIYSVNSASTVTNATINVSTGVATFDANTGTSDRKLIIQACVGSDNNHATCSSITLTQSAPTTPSYYIYWDDTDGTTLSDPTLVEVGAYPVNPTVSKTGYAFNGWSYSPALTNGMPASNVTATAQWIATTVSISPSSLTLDKNGTGMVLVTVNNVPYSNTNISLNSSSYYTSSAGDQTKNETPDTLYINSITESVTITAGTTTCTNVPIIATCNGVSGTGYITIQEPTPTTISVSPTSLDYPATTINTTTYDVVATVSNGSGTTSWSYDSTNIEANVSGNTFSLVRVKVPGTYTVTATNNGVSASATLNISQTTLSLNTTSATIKVGDTLTLSPTVTNTIWNTFYDSNNSNISLSAPAGTSTVVTGVTAGTSVVTVNNNSVTATCTITIVEGTSVVLDSSSKSILLHNTTTINATVTNGSGDTSWSTSDSSIVQIVNINGNALTILGASTGTATITASNNGVSKTCSVTVTATQITLSKTLVTLNEGGSAETITATVTNGSGNTVWSVSNSAVATISSSGNSCTITTVGDGDTAVTATNNGTTVTCDVLSNPTKVTLTYDCSQGEATSLSYNSTFYIICAAYTTNGAQVNGTWTSPTLSSYVQLVSSTGSSSYQNQLVIKNINTSGASMAFDQNSFSIGFTPTNSLITSKSIVNNINTFSLASK